MMPVIDQYLNQWRFYKNAILVFLAINVFALTLSAVLAVRYFGFKKDLGVEQKQLLHKIERVDDVFAAFDDIEKSGTALAKSKGVHTTADEESVLHLIKSWDALKTLSTDLDTHLPHTEHPLLFDEKTRENFLESRADLLHLRTQMFSELNLNLDNYHHNQIELILVGIITLLFGIILPQFILYLIGRTLNRLRLEMQNSVKDFLKSWNQTSTAFGPKPFQNVEFWLQILLLAGEQSSRLSGHPAARIAGELAFIIRQELRNSGTNAA
jgi:hypothetical protein